jgi:NHLM bacteriocin system ABC transporter ATP-binding protein
MPNEQGNKIDTAQSTSELFMLRLRYKEGVLVRTASNTPILLTDPNMAWIVYTGRVDVFMVPYDASRGAATGIRRHLFRSQAGEVVFGVGVDSRNSSSALLAVGDPGTQLLRVKRSALTALAQQPAMVDSLISLLDGWVTGLSLGLIQQALPQDVMQLELQSDLTLTDGQTVHPARGVMWVEQTDGSSRFMDTAEVLSTGDGFVPLSYRTWLLAQDTARVRAVDTRTLIQRDKVWPAMDQFHRIALGCIKQMTIQSEHDDHARWQSRVAADQRQVTSAMSRLAATLEPVETTSFRSEGEGIDPLLAACQHIGQTIGVTFRQGRIPVGRAIQDPIRDIAHASQVRVRQVMLRGDWWCRDSGPLLAYLTTPLETPDQQVSDVQVGRPVALLPTSRQRRHAAGTYDLLYPIAQTRTQVTAQVVAHLSPMAYTFYQPFPDRAITGRDLLNLGLKGSRRDILIMLLAAAGMGSMGLVIPMLTGVLFDTIIPGVQRNQLLQLGLVLLVSALAVAMFQLTRNIAVLRVEGRLGTWAQAATWDRLLRLPPSFFRQFTAGDLAERTLGISAISQMVSGAVISSLLSSVFSIFSLGLLFIYAPVLAWDAVGLVTLFGIIVAIAGYRQMQLTRTMSQIQSRIMGLVLQLVTGISKFRMAGAENRAFARWAREFSHQKQVAYHSRMLSNSLQTIYVAYPVLTLLAIFALVSTSGVGESGLSTGSFLAFNAALAQLLVACLMLSSAATSILGAIPLYERVKPVLQALPEVNPAKMDPGTLTGDIEISHVTFRYQEEGPLVLNDVSLHIHPSEFVAIVGSSGCGKSTLLRMLLKFEAPLTGAIFYDGQDLGRLDIEAVRRQAGVVLQDGKLSSGSILNNIIGSSALAAEDAWEAVRRVGLDKDIEQMPMGLHTVISAGGGNLSGGQRQRLLIARAIVNRPRILYFDEATSALDNPSQAFVSAGLEQLSATRVVIAHRLSTIVNADRIYVLDKGRIVQSGTYAELVKKRGLFAELAKRQQT